MPEIVVKLDVHGKTYTFTQAEIDEATKIKNSCRLSYQDIGIICLVLRHLKADDSTTAAVAS